MKKSTSIQQVVSFAVLLANAIVGRCSLEVWPPFEGHLEYLQPGVALASSRNSLSSYVAHKAWIPGDDNNYYYGVEATLDVYGFNLQPGQLTEGGVWIASTGDGHPIPDNGIQIGWHIYPGMHKDSRTHFYVGWGAKGSPDKGCFNMVCPGFRKTSSSIAPGDVIDPVSSINGTKQYITVRVFKDKSSGDWHVHYGLNGPPKPVGYFPKSLLPAMIDRPVLLRFGGYAARKKPAPNPPMGNGYVPLSSTAALVSNLKLIDADGNDHIVNTDLPYFVTSKQCYPLSVVDSGQFFYGGPGCVDN
ncbi:uncharacterized protein LOC123405486 [Hordeum vulgare subsp. vulgare]|nr:uncharacterized protein LOC123405486 [Hordeum vulgare subsp. vulgare]